MRDSAGRKLQHARTAERTVDGTLACIPTALNGEYTGNPHRFGLRCNLLYTEDSISLGWCDSMYCTILDFGYRSKVS